MKQSAGNYKRIVIKIGSSLLYCDSGEIDYKFVEEIVSQVSALVREGKEVIIVSSGAIAMGMLRLKLKSRPKDLSTLQASAATGQHGLISVYNGFFQKEDFVCAQVLLTWDDFSDRKRYLNARNTLLTLLKLKSIPIINENDTISTDEIKFGDNDRLSALVSSLICADVLIILSDVEGLMDRKGRVVRFVDEITPEIKALAHPTQKKTSVGGMVSKVEAAKIAIDSGMPCVIANGRSKNIILSILSEPKACGTLFIPKKQMASRKHWIAFGAKSKGLIQVDDGAREALINKKSLLSVGIIAIEGNFDAGDIVTVKDKNNCEFARGKVRLNSQQLGKVKGARSDKEVIHRNDIVILTES